MDKLYTQLRCTRRTIAMSAVRKKRFNRANKYNTVTVEDLV